MFVCVRALMFAAFLLFRLNNYEYIMDEIICLTNA